MTVIETVETVPLAMDAHGAIRVSGTRVTLQTILRAFLAGAGPEEIADRFPTVPLADLYQVVGYYLHHKAEIDAYLIRCNEEEEALRAEIERQWPPDGIKARLMARRDKARHPSE